MNRLILFCIVLLLASCKCNTPGETPSISVSESGDASMAKNLIEGVNVSEILAKKDNLLPQMCELVTADEIASILGIEASNLTVRDSSPGGSDPDHRTCFFKWNDPNYPNAGIMMQAMRNPMADEFPEYITVYMQSKKENGENALGDEYVHQFRNLDNMADEGIYNSDIGKYFWRFSDQVIFQLAFNSIHEQEEQFNIATSIGTHMIQSYLGLD